MMVSIIRCVLLAAFLVASGLSSACGDDQSTTSPTPTTPVRTTQTYGNTIGPGGSQFYSFTVLATGTTDVTLLSLRPAGVPTRTLSVAMGLGLGIPSGTDCALSTAITTTPALATQLSVTTNPNIYCVKIADVGNLTGSVDYMIRILHP